MEQVCIQTFLQNKCVKMVDMMQLLLDVKHLGKNAEFHVQNYGAGIEDRLTGDHETQRFDTFSYGVSDRGASITNTMAS